MAANVFDPPVTLPERDLAPDLDPIDPIDPIFQTLCSFCARFWVEDTCRQPSTENVSLSRPRFLRRRHIETRLRSEDRGIEGSKDPKARLVYKTHSSLCLWIALQSLSPDPTHQLSTSTAPVACVHSYPLCPFRSPSLPYPGHVQLLFPHIDFFIIAFRASIFQYYFRFIDQASAFFSAISRYPPIVDQFNLYHFLVTFDILCTFTFLHSDHYHEYFKFPSYAPILESLTCIPRRLSTSRNQHHTRTCRHTPSLN